MFCLTAYFCIFSQYINITVYKHKAVYIFCGAIKIVEFANSEDPDKAAHEEPLCLDLHCLPSSLLNCTMIYLGRKMF